MKLKHSTRLVLRDYWGAIDAPFSLTITSGRLWRDALKFARATNLRRYRESNTNRNDSDKDDIGALPIGLASSFVYNAAAWANNSGGDTPETLSNPFSGNVPGAAHFNDEPADYSGFSIEENTGFACRVFLHKAPKPESGQPETRDVSTLRWGAGEARWQLQIAEGDTALMRLSTNWTQSAEDTLHEMMGIEGPTSEEQQTLSELKAELYHDYSDVSLRGDTANTFGTLYDLAFLPEPCGRIAIYDGGQFVGEATHSGISKTRREGVVWSASALQIKRTGGHLVWQPGYWDFSSPGVYRFPYRTDLSGSMAFTWVGTFGGNSGTDIQIHKEAINSVYSQIVATLTTTNTRRTPFLYALHAFIAPEARNFGEEIALDTNDIVDAHGYPPIKDIEPQHEGEDRRAQYSVRLRDVNGQTFKTIGASGNAGEEGGSTASGLAFYYEVGEHRLCDLWIDDVKVMTGGIVRQATYSDLASAQRNQIRRNVTRSKTEATLQCCDPWVIMEECELEGGELVCDFLRWGESIRRCLQLIGTPGGEMSGVAAGEGRILPGAVAGEGWAVVNNAGPLSDFVSYLIERFGMGRSVWRSGAGIWQAGFRTSAFKQIDGHEVNFSADPARNRALTYPGRFAILRPLDNPRDAGEFYNQYCVQGASDYGDDEDLPLARQWTIRESIERGGGPGSPKYIGRRKKMRTIQDNSLRTADDVQWALRSTVNKYGKAPRFHAFETYYHEGLFVGDRVKVHDIPCVVMRQPTGSTRRDRMILLLREISFRTIVTEGGTGNEYVVEGV